MAPGPPPGPPPASSAAPSPLDVATLLERGINSKVRARQRLGELTRQHEEVDKQLQHFEARGYRAKRGRDEDATPAGAAPTAEPPAAAPKRDEPDAMQVEEGGAAKRARRDPKSEALSGMARDGAPRAPKSEALSGIARGGAPRQRPSPRVQMDDGSRQRNRNMFGLLRNTLQKAKEESTAGASAQQKEKMAKVEKKLRSDREKGGQGGGAQRPSVASQLEQALQTKEAIRKSTDEMDEVVRRLAWDSHKVATSSFLKTAAGPPIFFKPKVHSDASSAALRRQQDELQAWLLTNDSPLLKQNPLEGLELSGTPRGKKAAPAAEPSGDAGADVVMGAAAPRAGRAAAGKGATDTSGDMSVDAPARKDYRAKKEGATARAAVSKAEAQEGGRAAGGGGKRNGKGKEAEEVKEKVKETELAPMEDPELEEPELTNEVGDLLQDD